VSAFRGCGYLACANPARVATHVNAAMIPADRKRRECIITSALVIILLAHNV
jgi:hypothetical protein